MNILSVLVGIFFTHVVGTDVFNLDTVKLLNFSAFYNLNGNHIPYGPIASLDNLSISGNIQFDLFGEKLKITLKSSLIIQKSIMYPFFNERVPVMKYFTGATQTTSEVIYIDGKAGTVGFSTSGTIKKGFYSVSESACTHAKLPLQYMPLQPPYPRIEQGLILANQTLNRALSAGYLTAPLNGVAITVANDVATFTHHPLARDFVRHPYDTSAFVAKLKLDGTPVSFAGTLKIPVFSRNYYYNRSATTYVEATVDVGVTPIPGGAGTLTGITCSEGSATSLSSNPGILHSIALAETFIEHLSDSNPAVGEFVSKFPPLSELFPQMMMEEPEPDLMPWSVMLVSFVCGGGLVLLLVKFSSATTKLRREPLLEEA